MKKLLLFILFLILLPCFAFGATATPPAALKIKPVLGMVDYGVEGNYLQISVSVYSTIKSDKEAWLDGDADGIPGGMPYKHIFFT